MREKVNVQKFVGKSNGNLLKILAPNSDSGRKWPSVSDAQNAKSGFLAFLQTFLGRFYV